MRRALILLFSAFSAAEALKIRAPAELDPCATVDCASGLVCALAIPQSCNVAPCPKMPTCLPQNQTCAAASCTAYETCVLRSVTCITAPCYPIRECKYYPKSYKCTANEEYNECSLSGPCEPNCKDSFPICSNVTCGAGACECKPGYYRHDGACITKDKCPTPTCEKPNEVWNTCPSACTRTCRIARGKEEQIMCPAVCDIPQCTCAVGYVRDDDWNCVKEADCPQTFACDSPHEEMRQCSSQCEPTCDNRNPTCIESCGPAKCQCKKDYVRHEGRCLHALQCPLEGNTTFSRPIPADDDVSGSAEEVDESGETAPVLCGGVRCAGGSACNIRGKKPVCEKCRNNERIDTCPDNCGEETCDVSHKKRDCFGSRMCPPAACICDKGFVRNMSSGECVKRAQCPKASNSTILVDPIPWTGPLIRPAFPANGTILVDPVPIWSRPQVMPMPANWSRPMIKPFFPDSNDTIIGEPYIRHFGESDNDTMSILPFLSEHPDNGTMHILPIGKPQVRPLRPDIGITHPLIRPAFPRNETMHILPFLPRDDMHTMPFPENGTMISGPYVPTFNASAHVRPLFQPSNGSVHIMPRLATKPLIRPAFPDNGTVSILPFLNGTKLTMPLANETMHIMPVVDPIPEDWRRPALLPAPRPQTRPTRPDNDAISILPFLNGTKLTMPLANESMHIMPVVEPLVDPIPEDWRRPALLPAPRPQTRPTRPDNGTMHIMPIALADPRNWTKPLIRPAFPDNATATSVCANHTCPEGSWCEETPVFCIAAPCLPVPTCVTPRGEDCGRNEEYVDCAPACPETCRGVSECTGKPQPAICRAGCACKDKFKRDAHGACVPNHKCWKSAGCQENEVWHKCHTCEPTCDDAKEVCSAECASGCSCDEGFVRGPTGACIAPARCPKAAATNATVPA